MLAGALTAGACNLNNPGISPSEGQITYPIAMALSRPEQDGGLPQFLFVVNSNFQLSYNSGNVQTYSLDTIVQSLERAGDAGCPALSVCLGPECGPSVLVGDRGDASVLPDMTVIPEAGVDGGADAGPAQPGLDAGLAATDLDAGADGAAADAAAADAGDAGEDAGGDGGVGASTLDAGLADAGAFDAGLDGGVSATAPLTLAPGYKAPTKYGTQRGILCDGRDQPNQTVCCYAPDQVTADKFRASEVQIDSYASGIAQNPAGDRLYIPVRSSNKLLYIDVSSTGALSCGGSEGGKCNRGVDQKSKSDDPGENLPPQPTAIVAGTLRSIGYPSDRTFVATGHEQGQVSLFVEKQGVPVLEDTFVTSAPGVTSVSLAETGTDQVPQTLYVTASSVGYIARVGVRDEISNEPGKNGPRPILYETAAIDVRGPSVPVNLRDLQTNPADPRQIYALMGGFQQSLIKVELDESMVSSGFVVKMSRVCSGPSKLRRGLVDGQLFLFVSCYDGAQIFIFEGAELALVSAVRGLSGPFDFVIDEGRKYMYVGDFKSSVVRVVDLHGLVDRALPPPRIIATIGTPTYNQGLQ